ncbi:multidrug and toxic compound extrusion4 [Zea mays]|uniref:Protein DETOXIFICATION n=2 Tax=Zea mays TaxID=4577 RepID=A0A1D6MS01_MAIZE|nr:multidrug and toxic compound extrusion4 [Zea mays]
MSIHQSAVLSPHCRYRNEQHCVGTSSRHLRRKMLRLHHHSAPVSPHAAICPPSRLACSCICNKPNSRITASQGWSSIRRRITTVASGQSVPGYTPDDGDQCLETGNKLSFATVKEAFISLNSVGVRSELILLALPAVLGQAIDPIAQLMETAYIGRLGALELASAGIGISIFNIVSKIFNIPLLSIATSFVAEDISRSATKHPSSGKLELTSVSSALILAAGIGIMEALALFLGSGLFLKLMGVSPLARFLILVFIQVSPMHRPAKLFLSLRALGAPANVIMLAVQGLGNLSAVALLPLLIYGFKLGITGAAISTVVSQYIITVLLLWSLSKRAVLLPPRIDQLEFGGYLKSGGMLLGRTLSILLTMTIGTSMAARQGPTAMAAHQICLQVWLAVSLLADALAVSAQALIASSYAILDYKKVQKTAMFALQIGVFSGLALAIGLYASFGNIARLFTSDPEVLTVVKSCALFVCASQPINALAFIFDGLHYGVSDFEYVAQATIVVGVTSSLVLLWAPSVFGLAGVWAGLTTLMGLRMAAGILRLLQKAGPWSFLHEEP